MMMASQRSNASKRDESVVVAIDKDKGSQYALKWAIDKFSLGKGKSVTLLNVKHKPNSSGMFFYLFQKFTISIYTEIIHTF